MAQTGLIRALLGAGTLIALLLAMCGVTWAQVANVNVEEISPRFANDNGFVNLDKAPDTIGVLDSNGDVVKDANGKPVRIPFPTPPADDGAARSAQPADPDAPDIMVPYAEQVQR